MVPLGELDVAGGGLAASCEDRPKWSREGSVIKDFEKQGFFFPFSCPLQQYRMENVQGVMVLCHMVKLVVKIWGSRTLGPKIPNSPTSHHLLNCANSNQQNSLSKHTDIHPVRLWQVVSSTSWFQSNFNINFLVLKMYFCPGRVARLERC